MRASFRGGVIALVLCTSCNMARADEPVGEYTDPARIVFRGAENFSDDDLREGLFQDPDVLMAAHAVAPLDKFVAILPERIVAGYWYAGYLDAEASAVLNRDARRIGISITEGARYRAGEVRIEGANAIDAETLVRWIAEPHPGKKSRSLDPDSDDNAPVWVGSDGFPAYPVRAWWKVGDPATSYTHLLRMIEEGVLRAYAEIGRRQAVVLVSIEKDVETHVAWPLVKVLNEGPLASIESIEVTGLVKNSRDELLTFLDLKPDVVFDRALQTRIERALWNSARFCKYSVYAQQSSGATDDDKGIVKDPSTIFNRKIVGVPKPGAHTLSIKLTEYAAAPHLTELLSPEAQVMLKFRQWLLAASRGSEEIVARGQNEMGFKFEFILTADRGFLGNVTIPDPTGKGECRYATLVNDETIGLYALSRNEKLEFTPDAFDVRVCLEQRLANDDTQPFRLQVGAGAHTCRADLASSRVRLFNRMPPAVFAALTNTQHLEEPMPCVLKDGVLTMDCHDVQLQIDAQTGALLPFKVGAGVENLSVSVERGVFDERYDTLKRAADDCRNVFDPQRRFASAAKFVLDDPAWHYAAEEPAVEIAQGIVKKFCDAEILEAMLPWLEIVAADALPFFVPSTEFYGIAKIGDPWTEWFSAFRSKLPELARRTFAPDTWGSELTVELGLMSTGRAEYLAQVFEQGIAERGWGPLACRYMACGASSGGHATMVGPCTTRALERLSPGDFERDCRALLDAETVAGQVVLRTATFVRSLSAIEMLAVEAAGRKVSPAIGPTMRALRADHGETLDVAVPKALVVGWQAGWRDELSSHFSKLQSAPDLPVAVTSVPAQVEQPQQQVASQPQQPLRVAAPQGRYRSAIRRPFGLRRR